MCVCFVPGHEVGAASRARCVAWSGPRCPGRVAGLWPSASNSDHVACRSVFPEIYRLFPASAAALRGAIVFQNLSACVGGLNALLPDGTTPSFFHFYFMDRTCSRTLIGAFLGSWPLNWLFPLVLASLAGLAVCSRDTARGGGRGGCPLTGRRPPSCSAPPGRQLFYGPRASWPRSEGFSLGCTQLCGAHPMASGCVRGTAPLPGWVPWLGRRPFSARVPDPGPPPAASGTRPLALVAGGVDSAAAAAGTWIPASCCFVGQRTPLCLLSPGIY